MATMTARTMQPKIIPKFPPIYHMLSAALSEAHFLAEYVDEIISMTNCQMAMSIITLHSSLV